MLKRWLNSAWTSFVGPKGYLLIPVLVGAYVGAYTIVEAMHARSLNYSSYERSTFMTMVSSGNKASFIAGMKYFGDVQSIKVRNEPDIFDVSSWTGTYQPNLKPMWRWCRQYLQQCTIEVCGDKITKKRIDLSLAQISNAMLIGVDLSNSNLEGAWLINSDLTESSLKSSNLYGAYLNGARLVDSVLDDAIFVSAQLTGADLEDADAEGANFEGAFLEGANITGTKFTNANLKSANLTNAVIGGEGDWATSFAGADLTGAKWIDGKICGENSIGKCKQ